MTDRNMKQNRQIMESGQFILSKKQVFVKEM